MGFILGNVLSLVFFILAILHFYWAGGGKWGFEEALPANEKGEVVLNPRVIDSIVVGIGLLLFGVYYLLKIEMIAIDLPFWMVGYTGWIISSIFIIRAIGDFNYVGFFKKIKNTKFASWDTKLFSPLCLVIGLLGILIEVYS